MQMVQFSQVHFVRKYDSSFELYLQQNIFQQKFWSRIYMHSWGYFASLNMTLFLYISIISVYKYNSKKSVIYWLHFQPITSQDKLRNELIFNPQ